MIADHLAWLDQEIKRAAHPPHPEAPAPATPPPPPVTPPAPRPPQELAAAAPAPALTADPDAVLEEWTETEGSSEPAVSKMGCWLIFSALALLGVGGTVAFIYFYYK